VELAEGPAAVGPFGSGRRALSNLVGAQVAPALDRVAHPEHTVSICVANIAQAARRRAHRVVAATTAGACRRARSGRGHGRQACGSAPTGGFPNGSNGSLRVGDVASCGRGRLLAKACGLLHEDAEALVAGVLDGVLERRAAALVGGLEGSPMHHEEARALDVRDAGRRVKWGVPVEVGAGRGRLGEATAPE